MEWYLTLMTDSFHLANPSGVWAGCAIRRVSFHHRWGWRMTRYAYCTSDYSTMSLLPRFSSLQILVVTTTLTKNLVAVENSNYFCDICVPKISRYVYFKPRSSFKLELNIKYTWTFPKPRFNRNQFKNTFAFGATPSNSLIIIHFETPTSFYWAR